LHAVEWHGHSGIFGVTSVVAAIGATSALSRTINGRRRRRRQLASWFI
jgi:hypothetical protein